ncbi:ATP-binding protein [Streptomyces sp. ISL-94]|uniref:ATP-binding protein n=1 Tax=Streptomyces sp. ISL-94 TaxID=2819190 RepID=UPI001BEC3761|nr:ATP-binding protein [Streptomyces sp. ISL-94]MBT2480575.1 ATP-binding protein [Streptomyces sp. ISL-94]
MATMPPQRLDPPNGPPAGSPPQLVLASSPESVHAARTWARECVTYKVPDTPREHLDDVALVVSELVTNAIRYGTEPGDSVRVVIDAAPGRTRVEVHDPCRRHPRRKPESTERQRGRGLFILEALATAWSVDHRPLGKAVLAELHWQVTLAREAEAGLADNGPTVTMAEVLADLFTERAEGTR